MITMAAFGRTDDIRQGDTGAWGGLAIKKGGPWGDPAPAYFNGDLSNNGCECSPGYACMRIHQYDAYNADFWDYNYGVYSLENWIGKGWFDNRRTRGHPHPR